MIPEGNPNGRVAGKIGRDPKFKEAFTTRCWQPLVITALAVVHRDVRGFQVDVGVGVGVSNLCENPPLRCPLGHVWVSIAFFLLPLILPLPHLRRRLCVCACIRLEMLSLSLSLSLLHLEASVYLAIFSARLPPNVPGVKTETGAKLTAA